VDDTPKRFILYGNLILINSPNNCKNNEQGLQKYVREISHILADKVEEHNLLSIIKKRYFFCTFALKIQLL